MLVCVRACMHMCFPVQACVLSSPLGVTALMDLLSQTLEVLRNEALLLLVGLCNGCPQIAHIAAFEGAFEKLLAICGAEGGPAGGDVIVQDAAELINNMLRDNLANQRLFRWVQADSWVGARHATHSEQRCTTHAWHSHARPGRAHAMAALPRTCCQCVAYTLIWNKC